MKPLAEGWTLPCSWYTDPLIFQQEQQVIFQRTWQYVGTIAQVAQVGDYFVTQCGTVPIAIVRDRSHILRAFINVCRHRVAEVVQGSGNCSMLQCPYHGWTYGLDGHLHSAPRCEQEANFNAAELSLISVRIDCWGPFIFVNLDSAAVPLQDYLGELPDLIRTVGIDINSLQLRQHTSFDMAANWKVIAENFLECYHCPMNHPAFCQLIDTAPTVYQFRVSDRLLITTAPLRHSPIEAYPTDGAVSDSLYVLLYPNCTFEVYPGQENLSVYRFDPVSCDRTFGRLDYFFPPGTSLEFELKLTAFLNEVGMEDVPLVESVQRGLQSNGVPQGHLVLGSEGLIHQFQMQIYQDLHCSYTIG
jgi:phenylpropionate dioxygenase-like ring-hydroxylating dioxygenase large terminal subunit